MCSTSCKLIVIISHHNVKTGWISKILPILCIKPSKIFQVLNLYRLHQILLCLVKVKEMANCCQLITFVTANSEPLAMSPHKTRCNFERRSRAEFQPNQVNLCSISWKCVFVKGSDWIYILVLYAARMRSDVLLLILSLNAVQLENPHRCKVSVCQSQLASLRLSWTDNNRKQPPPGDSACGLGCWCCLVSCPE